MLCIHDSWANECRWCLYRYFLYICMEYRCYVLCMAWRVYERMHLANATTYCLRANASSECNYYEHWHWSYILHITHRNNVHHIAYCIREHSIPFLLYSWDTTLTYFYLLLFIIYLNVMGWDIEVTSSVGRLVGRSVVVSSRRRAFDVHYNIQLN